MAKTKPSKSDKAKANDSGSKVRVYEVLDALLAFRVDPGGQREHKWKGERVASVEFQPPELEARYLSTGAIRLVEQMSPEEWAESQVAADDEGEEEAEGDEGEEA